MNADSVASHFLTFFLLLLRFLDLDLDFKAFSHQSHMVHKDSWEWRRLREKKAKT
jgi:hypothetical protein